MRVAASLFKGLHAACHVEFSVEVSALRMLRMMRLVRVARVIRMRLGFRDMVSPDTAAK